MAEKHQETNGKRETKVSRQVVGRGGQRRGSQGRKSYCRVVVVDVVVVVVFHHLQPAGPSPNPACGHMSSPLTLQEVRYLSYVLEQQGSTITRARRLLLLPVESVYPPILKPSISSRH